MGELQPGSKRWEEREWLRARDVSWWEDVFDRIACGEKPHEVVKGYGIRFAMFGRVLDEDLGRKSEYEAALRVAADGMAFETLTILDEADPETVGVAKARSDGRWRIASRLNRDRWGERVVVEKSVRVEVDAGLVGFAGALLDRLSGGRVVGEVAQSGAARALELEAEAPELAETVTTAGTPPPLETPGRSVELAGA